MTDDEIMTFDDVPTATMQDILALKGWEWGTYRIPALKTSRIAAYGAEVTCMRTTCGTGIVHRSTYRTCGATADEAFRQAFTYFMNAEGKNT